MGEPRHDRPGLEWRTSSIAGRGLFAVDGIAAGTTVLGSSSRPPVNHSCDPNLGWTADGRLETLRDVAAGEELVVDYAMSITDPDFMLRCHCPSPRCRQMVEGTDWRIPQLQRRYAGHWSAGVQRLIDDETG